MYYKVIYKDEVVDVLDVLRYVKYQKKHDRMIFCEESEAQAILSSDGKNLWHVEGFYDLPIDGYDTVQLEPIDKYDYRRFKVFSGKTPEAIIDEFVKLVLIEKEVSQLTESLKRLYMHQEIGADAATETCNAFGVTEMETILVDDKEVE